MRKIVAIGGGEIGELETLPIDEKIIKLTGKKNPRVLYIPTAGGDHEKGCKIFQKIYGDKLGCKTDLLLLIKNKDSLTRQEIEKKILTADIIYVGGGDTLLMLKTWRKFGVDKLLRMAYEKGIVLAGLSAGAICWFRYGVSDAVENPKGDHFQTPIFAKISQFRPVLVKKSLQIIPYLRTFFDIALNKTGKFSSKMELENGPKLFGRIKGLGMVPVKRNITLSPHHIREKEIRDKSIREILLRTPGVCLAVNDKVALFIYDEISPKTKKKISKYEIWREGENLGITKYFKMNGKIEKEKIPESGVLDEV